MSNNSNEKEGSSPLDLFLRGVIRIRSVKNQHDQSLGG